MTFRCQPRVAHRSPPCKFFFCKCILRTAIDFAEAAKRSCGAWSGMDCRVAHRSPPRRFFYKCYLHGAIDFAALRSEAELEAWHALHISLTFSRLLGTNPHGTSQPTTQIFQRVQFAKVQLILRRCGCGANGRAGALCANPA
ncbi:MAG: hypothetical protein WA977_13580 [Halobacteriota archaeon]